MSSIPLEACIGNPTSLISGVVCLLEELCCAASSQSSLSQPSLSLVSLYPLHKGSKARHYKLKREMRHYRRHA